MIHCKFKSFRDWQSEGIGKKIYLREKQIATKLIETYKPNMVVQVEGRALLDHFPQQGFYYHVSEAVNREAPGYSVEAEQGFLPFPDQSVDCLLISHALELYMAHAQLFIEIDRVLAPNGVVFLSVLVNKWLKDAFPPMFHPLGRLQVAPQSMRKLRKRISSAGFGVMAEYTFISDKTDVLADRIQEQILYPMGLEIKRVSLGWNGFVGAVK